MVASLCLKGGLWVSAISLHFDGACPEEPLHGLCHPHKGKSLSLSLCHPLKEQAACSGRPYTWHAKCPRFDPVFRSQDFQEQHRGRRSLRSATSQAILLCWRDQQVNLLETCSRHEEPLALQCVAELQFSSSQAVGHTWWGCWESKSLNIWRATGSPHPFYSVTCVDWKKLPGCQDEAGNGLGPFCM